MATTSIADIVSLPVLQDIIDSRQYDRQGILLGTEYIKDITADVPYNGGGAKITIPYIADVEGNAGPVNVNQNTPCATLTGDKLSVLGLEVELKTSAVSFTNSMDALKRLGAMANPEEVMAQHVVKKAQDKILALIYDEIDTEVVKSANVDSHALTSAGANAKLSDFLRLSVMAFGDKAANEQSLNLLHSKVMYDVLQDTTVQTAVSYGTRNDQADWLEFAGSNWKQSDAVNVAGAVFSSYMLLPNGVMVYLKFDEENFGDTVRGYETLCFNSVFPFSYAVAIAPVVNGLLPVARLNSGSSLYVAPQS